MFKIDSQRAALDLLVVATVVLTSSRVSAWRWPAAPLPVVPGAAGGTRAVTVKILYSRLPFKTLLGHYKVTSS
jgi:hypothetical protein